LCRINTTKTVTSGFINTSDIEILSNGELTTSAGSRSTFVVYARNVSIYGKITGNVNITSSNLTIYPSGKLMFQQKGMMEVMEVQLMGILYNQQILALVRRRI
jgi:hypothetical protein